MDRAKTADEKFCNECGQLINVKAEICPKCGVRQMGAPVTAYRAPQSTRNKTVAGLLALFLGGLGMHKFYLGQGMQGVFYLIFCWTFIPSIIGFFEGIGLLLTSEQSFSEKFA